VGLASALSVCLFPGYQVAAYLGPSYNPFDVDREQKYLGANAGIKIGSPRWLTQFKRERAEQTRGRKELLGAFDGLKRDVERSGVLDAMDRYQQDAMNMILGGRTREAFDLDMEDPRI